MFTLFRFKNGFKDVFHIRKLLRFMVYMQKHVFYQVASSKIAIIPYKQSFQSSLNWWYHQTGLWFSCDRFEHLRKQCYSQYQSPSNLFHQQTTSVDIPVTGTMLPIILALHKKWSFPLRISSVNVTKSPVSCRFGHIYWSNP